MPNFQKRLHTAGQAMTEYLLLVALIALVVIAGVKFFGKSTKQGFQDAAGVISDSVREGVQDSRRP